MPMPADCDSSDGGINPAPSNVGAITLLPPLKVIGAENTTLLFIVVFLPSILLSLLVPFIMQLMWLFLLLCLNILCVGSDALLFVQCASFHVLLEMPTAPTVSCRKLILETNLIFSISCIGINTFFVCKELVLSKYCKDIEEPVHYPNDGNCVLRRTARASKMKNRTMTQCNI